MYLTNRWNTALESKLGSWINTYPELIEGEEETATNVEKQVFFYDLPSYILDLVIERSLEIEGLTDADGLGKSESPLVDVYLPCVSEEEVNNATVDEFMEVNGKMVCKNPRTYLWWDGWSLGSLASEEVGKRVAKMVKGGDIMRTEVKKERSESE